MVGKLLFSFAARDVVLKDYFLSAPLGFSAEGAAQAYKTYLLTPRETTPDPHQPQRGIGLFH